MVLADKTLDEILDYLDNSLSKLAKESLGSTEFHMDNNDLKQFLYDQYDIRLDNLLERTNSNIHHLESKIKNKIIQRRQKLLEKILSELKL